MLFNTLSLSLLIFSVGSASAMHPHPTITRMQHLRPAAKRASALPATPTSVLSMPPASASASRAAQSGVPGSAMGGGLPVGKNSELPSKRAGLGSLTDILPLGSITDGLPGLGSITGGKSSGDGKSSGLSSLAGILPIKRDTENVERAGLDFLTDTLPLGSISDGLPGLGSITGGKSSSGLGSLTDSLPTIKRDTENVERAGLDSLTDPLPLGSISDGLPGLGSITGSGDGKKMASSGLGSILPIKRNDTGVDSPMGILGSITDALPGLDSILGGTESSSGSDSIASLLPPSIPDIFVKRDESHLIRSNGASRPLASLGVTVSIVATSVWLAAF